MLNEEQWSDFWLGAKDALWAEICLFALISTLHFPALICITSFCLCEADGRLW